MSDTYEGEKDRSSYVVDDAIGLRQDAQLPIDYCERLGHWEWIRSNDVRFKPFSTFLLLLGVSECSFFFCYSRDARRVAGEEQLL